MYIDQVKPTCICIYEYLYMQIYAGTISDVLGRAPRSGSKAEAAGKGAAGKSAAPPSPGLKLGSDLSEAFGLLSCAKTS